MGYIVMTIAIAQSMALVTFGRGLSQPTAQSAAISCAPTSAATASGLLGFIQLLTGAVIAQIMPLFFDEGALPVAICILAAPIAALAALRCSMKQNRSALPSSTTA